MKQGVQMETISLPESVYDIDMQWLNDALHARGHEVTITRAERLEVACHICCACDIADRRQWEGPLLMHYLGALERAGGPRIDFGHAWLRYRQGLAYGYFIFIINETTFQTEATNTAYAARFGAAMVDHDTMRLLG